MLTESEMQEFLDLGAILGNLVFLPTGEIHPCIRESECHELLNRYRILNEKYFNDGPYP